MQIEEFVSEANKLAKENVTKLYPFNQAVEWLCIEPVRARNSNFLLWVKPLTKPIAELLS